MLSFLNVITLKTYTFFTTLTPWLHGRSKRFFRGSLWSIASAWARLLRFVFTRRRPSLNCRTHERTFFTSITPSLHVSINCWWIPMGFMPRKWRNRIITRCSSNVSVAIEVFKTLLSLDDVTSIQRVHLVSPNLKNSHPISNNFHVSTCFHSREKILGDLRTWMHHVIIDDKRVCLLIVLFRSPCFVSFHWWKQISHKCAPPDIVKMWKAKWITLDTMYIHVRWYKNLALRSHIFFSIGTEPHINRSIPSYAPSTVLSMSKFYVEINASNFIPRSLKSWNIFSNSALRNPYFLVVAAQH